MIELYHNDMSVCAQKVRFALGEKTLQWKNRHLNLRAGDQQKPEYVKLNPNAVVPTLVGRRRRDHRVHGDLRISRRRLSGTVP